MSELENERRRNNDRDFAEVKELLRTVDTKIGVVSQNQARFEVEVSYIKAGLDEVKGAIGPMGKELARLGQKVEDLEDDTHKQWDHITGIKDEMRELKESNNAISHMAADNEFWDADTKKMVIRWAMIIISLAFITSMGLNLSDIKEMLL